MTRARMPAGATRRPFGPGPLQELREGFPMLSMRNLSVRSRFYVVMSLVAISLLIQAGWGMVSARTGITTVTEMFDQADRTAQEVGAMREAMASVRRYQAEMIATAVSNPTGVEPVHQSWKKQIAAL